MLLAACLWQKTALFRALDQKEEKRRWVEEPEDREGKRGRDERREECANIYTTVCKIDSQ